MLLSQLSFLNVKPGGINLKSKCLFKGFFGIAEVNFRRVMVRSELFSCIFAAELI